MSPIEKSPFFLSLTIPYVNADPHIGYALEAVQGDAMARYERLLGKEVFFVFGTDENSLKNVQAAQKAGEDVGSFVARHAAHFEALRETLNLSATTFIRTTEKRHFLGCQKFWQKCDPNDIYKKMYRGLYCVGCEVFYSEDELDKGLCPEHHIAPDVVEEENYFFRLSRYEAEIERLIKSNSIRVYPESKKNEMLSLLERGLEDFSISRSTQRAHGWGVPVPEDESQIMYVWFDALTNYITALDYANDGGAYHRFWLQDGAKEREVVHVLGKGVARFHLVYWLGMLMSAGIPLPTTEFVHGYITVNGQKMSKSVGNVVHPQQLVEKYGVDALRYYFLGAVSAYQDGDFSFERFHEVYTTELVNGVGNLTSRILTMLVKYSGEQVPALASDMFDTAGFWKKYRESMERYAYHDVIHNIKTLVTALDTTISEKKPWEMFEKKQDILPLLYQLTEGLRHVAIALLPIIPSTAENILTQLGVDHKNLRALQEESNWGQIPPGQKITKADILFPRIKI